MQSFSKGVIIILSILAHYAVFMDSRCSCLISRGRVGCIMKKPYQKPRLVVEYYSLTQSISSCASIKINAVDANCVLKDPDSTNEMINWAHRRGFLDPCVIDMSGYKSDSICYHTSINAAFTS